MDIAVLAAQFCKDFGAPAKPFRMALAALIIKARLGLTDEELVEQIKENPYLHFFIDLEAFQHCSTVSSLLKPSRCLMNSAPNASLTDFAGAPVVGLN
jgi:hypothetical protein